MFDVKLRSKLNHAHHDDARLKALLQQWHGIEPCSDFEFCVWRRIRATTAAESAAPGLWAIARAWLSAEPAWVPAAVAAGLLVGVSMALSVPQMRTAPYAAAPLLHSQTLAGAYLTMASGGTRCRARINL